MAAAQPDNGSKQDDTVAIQPLQRPKPPHQHYSVAAAPPSPVVPLSPSVVHRYPTILLNARKQVPRPAAPPVVRRLAPAVPRRQLPSNGSGTPVLISADSLRRTVYASLPAVSYHSTGHSNGLTSTIVSFAGKQQRHASTASELVSVVRPTLPPPATIYKLVSAGGTTTGRKRMPQLAPKPPPPPPPPSSQGDQLASLVQQASPPLVSKNEQKPTVASLRQRRPATAGTVQYNNAHGWRRILRNKVIVYVSPSNIVLHNYEQVKEYLLSSGTCKCGLPCPFNPERFFQFDAQIPNQTLAPKNRHVLCSHLQQATEGRSKRLHAESDSTTRPVTNTTTTTTTTTTSAVLLKTPPWRKNVPVATSSPQAATTPVTETSILRFSKPLGDIPSFTSTLPDAKGARDTSPEQKKKPTFKDDPTGYLNQQTAILHSSISFLHSPDRRSPLGGDGLSPKPGSELTVSCASPPKDDRSPVRNRQRTLQAKITSLSGVVKYEAKASPPVVTSPAKSLTGSVGSTKSATKAPLPIARLAADRSGRMAYYVKANAARPSPPAGDQCSLAKVAKLTVGTGSEPNTTAGTITTNATMTTTTALARTVTTPATATMYVPTRSSPHVINAGGAQIVVIDGLQHTAGGAEMGGGRVRIGGFQTTTTIPARPQIVPTVPLKPTVVNYNLSRLPNGTTTGTSSQIAQPTATSTGAMLLNGTNIIHLSNGLAPSTFHGAGLLTTHHDVSGSPNASTASGKPNALTTLPNGTLGLATGSTVVLNPTTSIRFANSTNFTAPGSGFPTVTVASNTYHYSPCPPGGETTVSLDVTGARKLNGRALKPLNGTTLGSGAPSTAAGGLTGGLVLPTTLNTQPQTATFQQQLQPGPYVQIASPYGGLQNMQLASSLSGITVVPVSKSTSLVPQQQHHHQPQPYGMLGQTQTILLPAGSMVMASDATSATLLQIQNMATCAGSASLLAGQTGLVLRHPKPSPSATGFLSTVGQQSYLIGAGGGATARTPTITQRHLGAAGNSSGSNSNSITTTTSSLSGSALFTSGGGLQLGATIQQQLPQPLTTTTPAKLIEASSHTVLLHPNGTKTSLEGGERETKPATEGAAPKVTNGSDSKPTPVYHSSEKSMSVSCSENDVTGMTLTLKGPLLATAAYEQQKKQPWPETFKQQQQPQHPVSDSRIVLDSPNRTGRTVSLLPTASGGCGRVGSVGLVRRALPPVQAVSNKHSERVQLAIIPPPPSTPTEGPTCRPTDVLAERSYDITPLSECASVTVKRSQSEPVEDDEEDGDDNEDDEDDDDDDGGSDCKPEIQQAPSPSVRPGQRQFRVGDLVWGAVRGFPAWPGKVLPMPPSKVVSLDDPCTLSPSSVDAVPDCTDHEHVWVRWFGTGRINAERVEIGTLQSLSEGLEIHHRAQKDARKSRKLNAQLEQAIQQAMQELDHAAQASSGFGRRGSTLGKQRRPRQQRHQRRQVVGKRHRTVNGNSTTNSTAAAPSNTSSNSNSNMCNRKAGSVRYLRGNKFKAKS